MFEKITSLADTYFAYAMRFFTFPINPANRLFVVYLLSSLAIVYWLYRKQKSETSFKSFVFPKSVWSQPSAWLDVRYFFFHGLIGHFLVHILVVGAFISGLSFTISLEELEALRDPETVKPAYRLSLAIVSLIVFTVLADFIIFILHYLQHKVPILWQFHKVHHSGEVMHPMSNFREHPVDNLTYGVIYKFVSGAIWGVFLGFIGFTPTSVPIMGITIFSLAFNLVGYQLRHSHIWLRWPGNWSKVFPSPAHHHVHHSRHPEHLDKNFAFLFPVWDVLFKTYEMPADNRDVEFGIVEDASELNSCVNLYLIPFRDAYRVIKNDLKPKNPVIAQSEQQPLG